METCTNCNGKGEYMKTSSIDNLFRELRWCYLCKGTGKVEDKK